MYKIYLLAMIMMPLISFTQSNLEIDKRLDSLTVLLSSSQSESERKEIISNRRKLASIKYARSAKVNYRNLDSIEITNIILIDDLWLLSKNPKVSSTYRDSIYTIISSHKVGLDIMVDHIDFEMWDMNSMSSDDFGNYPVFTFLAGNFSSIYFDYIDQKVCEDAYGEKLDLLLLTTVNLVAENKYYKQKIFSLLDKDCVGLKQKERIRLFLSIFEE